VRHFAAPPYGPDFPLALYGLCMVLAIHICLLVNNVVKSPNGLISFLFNG